MLQKFQPKQQLSTLPLKKKVIFQLLSHRLLLIFFCIFVSHFTYGSAVSLSVGLEGQLLGIVVRKEKPELEEQKDQLVLTIAEGKNTLKVLEDDLLRLLNESEGSLLDNEELFTTLQVSRATSISIKESLENSELTEVEIDAAREVI